MLENPEMVNVYYSLNNVDFEDKLVLIDKKL